MGWGEISSDQPIVAGTMVGVGGSATAYGVDAIPAEAFSQVLYAPVVRRAAPGTTGIAVVNPEARQVVVEVRFQGAGGACQGKAYLQSARLPAKSNAIFYQGGGSMPLTGKTPLPPGCLASAVIAASSGRIAATVNDAGPGWPPLAASGFRAAGTWDTAERLVVPMWFKNLPGSLESTVVTVMNTAADEVTFRVRVWDHSGIELKDCGQDCWPITVPGYGTYEWDVAEIAAIPDGSYGWARISGNRPIVAQVGSQPTVMQPLRNELESAAYTALACWETGERLTGPDAQAGLVYPGPWGGSGGAPSATPGVEPTASPTLRHEPTGSATESSPTSPLVMASATPTTTATPSPTLVPVDTPTPHESPRPLATPTPSPTPTTNATAPPTPTPADSSTPTPASPARVCPFILRRVPSVAIDWATANPDRVYGWDELAFPGRPPSPVNTRKHQLSIRNVAMPFDAWFNPLVYKPGARKGRWLW